MKTSTCPRCPSPSSPSSISKFGSFYRKSDRKRVQRFFCKQCHSHFSAATVSNNYRQKKRQLNHFIARLLVAEVSQRECQRILGVNRKTIVRKFIHMGLRARIKLEHMNRKRSPSPIVEFDDMETFEHTKCKPLSITLAVESKSRWILGFQISQMPSNGPLADFSRKKYGPRADMRKEGREVLFKKILPYVEKKALLKSDENPHYTNDVKKWFPHTTYVRYKGRRAAIVGQGELKKIGFDPLFSLNHTCATIRARACRLIRRTWCTTKKSERLSLHVALVALHHNSNLMQT